MWIFQVDPVCTRALKSGRRVRRGWCEVTGEGPCQLLEEGGREPRDAVPLAAGRGQEAHVPGPQKNQRLTLDSDFRDCQWQPCVALSHCVCSDLMRQYWSDTVLCPVEETPFHSCS